MSTEPRTVHVNVFVTKSLEIEEPSWCVGHRDDRAQYKADITHNGPEISARIDTRRGPTDFLTAWISQAPYSVLTPEPLPVLAIEVGGDILNCEDTADVRAFANLVRAHLDVLEQLAVELERIRGGGE
ncbi:DUF6907 domain-containing protein [Streptomyces sp. A012304]|uniref:DUF6907 domain-containing protein n=1 Tax=Streptomyces sp. A012304 TaxID=375446 RepID=UPI00222F42AF|nr:hypothetical protein [Streptomyces sp. A012304]GKQ38901.1 hypothetical protein ALMP_54300 [Streptomyces sp. A012304]